MSRPLRIEFENAWYHVMHRGTERCSIFKRKYHPKLFIDLLEEISETFQIEIHAFCLMNNHYHLLINTPHANLARAMRHLNGVYTQRFNRSMKRDGSLFRGRYKSIIVMADNYLVSLSRYIHRNPVEAKMIDRAADYPWSSYAAYINAAVRPPWLRTGEVLRRVGAGNPVESYQALVENSQLPSLNAFFRSKQIPAILGDKSFRQKILAKNSSINSEVPHQRRLKNLPTIDNIISTTASVFCVSKSSVSMARRGKQNQAREVAIYICRHHYGHYLHEIGLKFGGIKYSSVSQMVTKARKEIEKNEALRKMDIDIRKRFNVQKHLYNKQQKI